MSEMFPATVNLEQNAANLRTQFEVTPTPEQEQWARAMSPVHGASFDSAAAILQGGDIKPYASLAPKIAPGQTSPYLTDKLDIALGQHKFVFWNIGKTSPADLFPVYFCAYPSLIGRDDAYVAMQDITAYGGLVSLEAEQDWLRHNPGADTSAINASAAKAFFESLVRGADFTEIFARFLATHYPDIGDDRSRNNSLYWREVTYPGEELQLDIHAGVAQGNFWPGPQLQVAHKVSLNHIGAIIVTDPFIRTIPGYERYRNVLPIFYAADFAKSSGYPAGPYSPVSQTETSAVRSLYTNFILYRMAQQYITQMPT